MKKFMFLFLGILVLSGCTTYTVKKGTRPYDKGYVVARRGYVIPEFTIGANNTVPEEVDLARERFERRKKTVEYYYEKLGDIDSNFKSYFLKPVSAVGGLMTSPFRLPVVAYQDYKYSHNPEYKEKMDKIDDEKDRIQNAKIKVIKDYLNKYIQDDLRYENELMAARGKPVAAEVAKPEEKPAPEIKAEEQAQVAALPVTQEVVRPEEKTVVQEAPAQAPQEEKPAEAQVAQEQAGKEEVETKPEEKEKKIAEELAAQEEKKAQEQPAKVSMWQKMKNVFKPKEKPAKVQEEVTVEEKPKVSLWQKMKNIFKPKEKAVAQAQRIPGEPPVAVIVAKPAKGYSPLKVHFWATRSRAVKGKIISYEWDFGDGDKSKKPNPVNTFLSGSFDPKKFTVTLTVQDDKGNVGTATVDIEVLNK
jgi:hypothetical protein